MTEALTQEEFRKLEGGAVCPICQSADPDFEGGLIYNGGRVDVYFCKYCRTKHKVNYKLESYEELGD